MGKRGVKKEVPPEPELSARELRAKKRDSLTAAVKQEALKAAVERSAKKQARVTKCIEMIEELIDVFKLHEVTPAHWDLYDGAECSFAPN